MERRDDLTGLIQGLRHRVVAIECDQRGAGLALVVAVVILEIV